MAGVLRKDRFATSTLFSFADVERQATERLRNAQAEAAQIIRDARQAAERESERVKSDARASGEAEGRRQGREQAYQDAKQSAIQESRQQLSKLTHALTVALTEFEQQRHERISAAEQELIRLAVALAERICRLTLSARPQAALENIKAALALAQHEQDLELHISASDAQLLQQIDPGFAGTLNGKSHVKLIPQEHLKSGACRLTTRVGTIDTSIDVQLQRAAEALLSPTAAGETISPPSTD